MITSPRKSGEKDGPKEVHLILLDNSRSRIYEEKLLRDTLLCIRCGACMNHCPVYSRIGGHAYDTTYPGPIGKILTPQIMGLHEAGHLTDASSLCGACVEVCPVKVPITGILLRLRHDRVESKGKIFQDNSFSWDEIKERSVWKIWSLIFSNPLIYRLSSFVITKIGSLIPVSLPLIRDWTLVRSKPNFVKKRLHQLVREQGLYDK